MLVMFMMPALADNNGRRNSETMRREMREYKKQYLAQEMGLDDGQKEKFNALYDKMSDERLKLFRATRQMENRVRNASNVSDADYKKAVKALSDMKQKDAQIEKHYDSQFSKFLTARQIFKMKEAEGKFRERMHRMKMGRKAHRRAKAVPHQGRPARSQQAVPYNN